MKLRRRILGPMAGAFIVGWTMTLGTVPAHAGFLTESTTSVGTLNGTNLASPNPKYTLTLGGSTLLNFVGDPDSGGSSAESIFKFALGSLLPGTQITSASFTFTVAGAQASYSPTQSVIVGGLGSSNPIVTMADFSVGTTSIGTVANLPDSAPMGLNETFSLNATSLVQSLVNGGVSNVGFLTSASVSGGVYLYGDSTYGASYAPSLSITYVPNAVPEPSSCVLCGLAGVIGLAVSRVRRSRAA